MMMIELSRDLRWMVLSYLSPAAIIIRCRVVCREWRCTVDGATQNEWKVLYHAQVCDGLNVGTSFDWRSAAVIATGHAKAVEALCMWKSRRVWVAVPWNEEQRVVNVPLRNGVVRAHACSANNIDFVYDDAFRLRGMPRSCMRRNDVHPCINCRSRSKQRCLNPRYDYYIRSVNDTEDALLDELLGFRLASNPLITSSD